MAPSRKSDRSPIDRARGRTPCEDWHRILRFHPSCPFGQERAPAMVSLLRDIITDQPHCIQRTRLTDDGQKIDRQMLGPAKGAAINIDPDADITMGLNIGEGLETTLSGRAMGFAPAWALGSAGAIAKFPVLPGIEALRIFGEHDDSGANKKAALECADRWHAAGIIDVGIVWPVNGGDLNDALRLAP
jgi:putative DNA primase/helicase